MSEELVAVSERIPVSADSFPASPLDSPVALTPAERRRRWFELGLVLLIAFSGAILHSISLLRSGPEAHPQVETLRWVNAFVQEAATLLLLGYVLARRNLGFAYLGLRWSLRDLGAGLGVAFLSYLSYSTGYVLLHRLQHAYVPSAHNGPSASQIFGHAPLAAIAFTLINPFFEELIVRAYLMTEVAALTGSWMLATVLSLALQTSYHLYYGWIGALSLSFQFLVFAAYYAWRRKAAPIVFAHGVFDILGYLTLR